MVVSIPMIKFFTMPFSIWPASPFYNHSTDTNTNLYGLKYPRKYYNSKYPFGWNERTCIVTNNLLLLWTLKQTLTQTTLESPWIIPLPRSQWVAQLWKYRSPITKFFIIALFLGQLLLSIVTWLILTLISMTRNASEYTLNGLLIESTCIVAIMLLPFYGNRSRYWHLRNALENAPSLPQNVLYLDAWSSITSTNVCL